MTRYVARNVHVYGECQTGRRCEVSFRLPGQRKQRVLIGDFIGYGPTTTPSRPVLVFSLRPDAGNTSLQREWIDCIHQTEDKEPIKVPRR